MRQGKDKTTFSSFSHSKIQSSCRDPFEIRTKTVWVRVGTEHGYGSGRRFPVHPRTRTNPSTLIYPFGPLSKSDLKLDFVLTFPSFLKLVFTSVLPRQLLGKKEKPLPRLAYRPASAVERSLAERFHRRQRPATDESKREEKRERRKSRER